MNKNNPMPYDEAASYIKSKIGISPKVALILGTGLNPLADEVKNPTVIKYDDIPGFAVSTAPMHAGQLVIGHLYNTPVLVMQGRLHYYEGWSLEQVVFPIRVFKLLGIEQLIITNAAGSLRKELAPGDLVRIDDHINFLGTNPLVGPNQDRFGERFPSLHQPYCPKMAQGIINAAKATGVELKQGVYMAVSGPSIETKAECAAFATLGADLVGMSTVPEVIAAVHAGLRVAAISAVTNYSNLITEKAHVQEEFRNIAKKAGTNLQKILGAYLQEDA